MEGTCRTRAAGGGTSGYVAPAAPAHGPASHRLAEVGWARVMALMRRCSRRSAGHGVERGGARGRGAVSLLKIGHEAPLSPWERSLEGPRKGAVCMNVIGIDVSAD